MNILGNSYILLIIYTVLLCVGLLYTVVENATYNNYVIDKTALSGGKQMFKLLPDWLMPMLQINKVDQQNADNRQ
jgi:hypothetical protein